MHYNGIDEIVSSVIHLSESLEHNIVDLER